MQAAGSLGPTHRAPPASARPASPRRRSMWQEPRTAGTCSLHHAPFAAGVRPCSTGKAITRQPPHFNPLRLTAGTCSPPWPQSRRSPRLARWGHRPLQSPGQRRRQQVSTASSRARPCRAAGPAAWPPAAPPAHRGGKHGCVALTRGVAQQAAGDQAVKRVQVALAAHQRAAEVHGDLLRGVPPSGAHAQWGCHPVGRTHSRGS